MKQKYVIALAVLAIAMCLYVGLSRAVLQPYKHFFIPLFLYTLRINNL